jgi:Tfp pilus assembly protein PilX
MKSTKLIKGQALVLVLLSLAVVLTLVLFVLSRSVTDVTVSNREEDAVRAFSAAEAGVEQALVVGAGSFSAPIGDATFTAVATDFAKGTRSVKYPINLASGDTITTWFTAHNADGSTVCSVDNPCFTGNTLKICWGKSGTASNTATTPAVEISIFYETTPGNPATIRIGRSAFDPFVARTPANAFAAPDSGTCTVDGETYAFHKTITMAGLGIPSGSYNVQNGLQFAKIRMFHNTDVNHRVAIDANFGGNTLLPSQGIVANSTGEAGESTRRLEVFQSWPEPPFIFDYAIYSSGGLVK